MRTLTLVTMVLATWLAPYAAAQDCKPLQRFAQIPFDPDTGGQILVPVTLGGLKTHLMLDTGAVWSILRADVVERLNLRTRKVDGLSLFDAAGKSIDKIAIVPDFQIGELHVGRAEFFIGHQKSAVPFEKSAGELGRNTFSKADLEIDNAGKSISLFSQDHCPGEGVYWSDEAVILDINPLSSYSPRSHDSLFPNGDGGKIDQPHVRAELEGKPVELLFDTGASITAMDTRLARRLFGIGPGSPGVEPAGEAYTGTGTTVPIYRMRFRELTISGIRFENVPVLLGQFGDFEQLVLGMPQISQLRMFFAFKEGKIYVTAANAGRNPQPAK
jgi:predicted aspartyl protease